MSLPDLQQFQIELPDWLTDWYEKLGINPWVEEEPTALDPYITAMPSDGFSSAQMWGMGKTNAGA